MSDEYTLCLVKPDAMASGHLGAILQRLEAAQLRVVAARLTQLTLAEAQAFYAEHADKPFYEPLVAFMCSGPLMAVALRGEGAIGRYRQLMGATDPAKAAPDTLRALFAKNGRENAVHGSDSPESAARELAFFFSRREFYG